MEYNSSRKPLLIAEYGRSIQTAIEMACKIEDSEKRNSVAQQIVTAMGALNPQMKEMTDYKIKLWDHLFIMSDFKLDVESPFPKPEKKKLDEKPGRVPYPSSKIKYKYYGKTMEQMITHISNMENNENKQSIAENLANFMKMSYLTWNKDTVDDSTILDHLQQLSDGKIVLGNEARLSNTNNLLATAKEKMRQQQTVIPKKNKNKNKNKNKYRR